MVIISERVTKRMEVDLLSETLTSMFEAQGRHWNNRYKIPEHVYAALRHNPNEDGQIGLSTECQRYIKLLRSLKTIKEIPTEYYLILQKLFLDIQAYDLLHKSRQLDIKINDFKSKDNVLSTMFATSLSILLREEHHSVVEENDTVAIKYNKGTCYCTVNTIRGCNKTGKIMLIAPKKSNDPEWPSRPNGKNFLIRFLPCYWTINASLYALNILSAYNITDIMYPKLQTTPYNLPKQMFKWNQAAIEDDPEQQQAIKSIFNQTSKPAPYILFGPPGTGKTTTVVETVLQIWQQDSSRYVLVLAGSNTAVDEIAKRLIATHVIPSKYIYRMYSGRKKSEEVNKTIRPSSNFYKKKVLFLSDDFLYSKHVILATVASSARLLAMNLPKDHFSFIIMDEASQCAETEVLIPYALTCATDDRGKTITHAQVVFCGDPCQLGPVILSKIIKPLLEKSVLERIMQYEPYKRINGNYNPQYITQLRRNYRSRVEIIHLPSLMFYKGTLKACFDFDETEWILNWPELKNQQFPVVFCAVKGQEQPLNHRKSNYNKKEVDTTVRYVKKLMDKKLNSYHLDQDDIGIVTPFTGQKIMIERALISSNLEKIAVGTVDLFQGQEKKVIIISTVRSNVLKHNEESHIGFLSHPKRFNVALTRAKIFVLVIGNPEILCTSKLWKQLWEYCAENDACINHIRSGDKKKVKNKENAPWALEPTL